MPRKGEKKYNLNHYKEIFDRIAVGETVKDICNEPDTMTEKWFYSRVLSGELNDASEEDKELLQLYTQARERQMEHFAEEILEISDEDGLDMGFTEDGKPYVKGENIQRSRLKVDTRKWLMSKLNKRRYGDDKKHAHDVKHSGEVVINVTLENYDNK